MSINSGFRYRTGAGLIAFAIAASAAAETVVLDFASDDFFGPTDDRFLVDPLRLDWTEGNGEFATDGVLTAVSTGPGANGILFVESTGDELLELISFQIGGHASTTASAVLGLHIWENDSWNFVEQESYTFAGNEDLFDFNVSESILAEKFAIVLVNAEGLGGVGLDNVSFNVTPTPGALALLGLAGFAGRRRRG